MAPRPLMIAVCGGGEADFATMAQARQVGQELAEHGAHVVTGGLGGVMEAACEGAKKARGLTIGIVPGPESRIANSYVDVAIASGMAEGRNALIVHTADGLIALRGAYGTLSEVSLALAMGKPVVTVGDWCPIPGVISQPNPSQAVECLLKALQSRQQEGRH